MPVRRNSDNVLGFYNRVNGEFYTNSGTGTFTSVTCSVDIDDPSDACDAIASCSPVGYGYYASENYTNYGSDGVRNQCPNGGGTVVNNQPINNATSIYNCEGVDPCTGATYPDYTTGICTACPTGYDADTTNNKEKALKLIRGDTDKNATIVYSTPTTRSPGAGCSCSRGCGSGTSSSWRTSRSTTPT